MKSGTFKTKAAKLGVKIQDEIKKINGEILYLENLFDSLDKDHLEIALIQLKEYSSYLKVLREEAKQKKKK